MAKNITLWGASFTDVPSVDLPTTGGGTANFIDTDDVITYYTGTAEPTAGTGDDADIYLKVVS